MLLYDRGARVYNFYIETSVNQNDWEMAVDKRNEQLRSWQDFTFTPRPVVFFRITGTSNSDEGNNVSLAVFDSIHLIGNIQNFTSISLFISTKGLSLCPFRESITRCFWK